ncbi:DUF92 domain-containing protein [Halobacteriales archaeon QS_4_70_19]|nr:MAG: DUF92 domain-containing protein [Halobacteriales archaeon QS_4_70_19]
MTGNVRRAGAYALIGSLALVVPVLAVRGLDPLTTAGAAALPFVAVGLAALYVVDEGPLFDLLARPGDYEESRLFGLAAFAFACAGLALLVPLRQFGLPPSAFVGSVAALVVGNVAAELVRLRTTDPFAATVGFALGGLVAAAAGFVAVGLITGGRLALPLVTFLAAIEALVAALLRTALFERDDPLVLVSVALLLWGFLELGIVASPVRVGVGIGVSALLGYVAFALGTASLTGMLTGVLLALLAIVLGGYGWFALLITFFGLGGLSSKYRYEEKRERGIAEDNEGARGSGNVLANSAVALVAVVLFAASGRVGVPPELFRYAFAGSVATAMADTLSSEIGGLFDEPRLITTLGRVEPGTDGAITWQGQVAGLVGAGIIAGIAAVFFDLGPLATGLVVAGGVAGTLADSLLGATLEGPVLDNQGVNLLATLAGAVVSAGLALALALV